MKYIFILLLLATQAHAQSYKLSQQVMTNCNMASATCISYGLQVDQLKTMSFQSEFSGSPVGTLVVQVSNDIVQPSLGPDQSLNVVNWTTYTGSSYAVSGAGTFAYNVAQVGYKWIRILYTKTSGTGTMNATYEGKGM